MIREGAVAKLTAHRSKAQSEIRTVSKGSGSGWTTGPSNTRPPDPDGAEDKIKSLARTDAELKRGEGRYGRNQSEASRGQAKFDDDMVDAEQGGSATSQASN